jgi:hypothetical protein
MYIFRPYQKSSTIRHHTLHIDKKSGIVIRLNLHVATRLNQYKGFARKGEVDKSDVA